MNNFLLLFFTFFTISNLSAQIDLPFYTGFDIPEETVGWDEYRLGDLNPFYNWHFTQDGVLKHFYPVGGEEITNDWMVSPALNFENGAFMDSIRFKSSGFGFPFGLDTVAMYHLAGSQDPELATEVNLIKVFTDEDFMNDDIWKVFYDIELPTTLGNSYIAFRYQTIVNWFDVSIDDIAISQPLSVDDLLLETEIEIYPNPSSEWVNVKLEEGIQLSALRITDINGKEIQSYNPLDRRLDISELSSGHYLLQLVSEDHSVVKKLVVE